MFIIPSAHAANIVDNQSSWASSYLSGFQGYKAFDNNGSTVWIASTGTINWIGIDLGYNYSIINMSVFYTSATSKQVYINGSHNNITWTQLSYEATNTGGTINYNINNYYRYINITIIGASVDASIVDVKIYSNIPPKPDLIYPYNSSVQYKSYPPLTSDINFTWNRGPSMISNLFVAKDSNFNLIVADTTTANNYSVQSLEAGNYWWKVRYYNSTSTTYGNYSNTFNFTITNNYTSSGKAGIEGIVYEIINGVQTPISSATVYISNSSSTWSESMTTGTNGYYLFDNLTNSTTYYVYAAKKEYTSSTIEYVTTGIGVRSVKNIQLKPTEPTDFESDKQYVKFKARWLWCFSDCDIAGATISVYNSGDVTAYASGVTDSTGSISFRLYKTQLYRVIVVNTTAGISQEMTLYPKDTEYVFLITNTGSSWQDHDIQEKDAINIMVTKTITNATLASITINYTDSLIDTSTLTYYINQSNNTMVQSWTWASGTFNHTFTISPYSGKSFVVHVVATHGEYGTIDRSYAVPFEKTGVGISGISNTLWLWFAVGIMFFTGAMFTSTTAEKGLLIVCAEGWIFFFMGMFASLNPIQFVISLTLASVIAVLAYFKRSNASEGYT